jgi:hypothetical protein
MDTGSKVRHRAAALLRQAAEAKALDGRLIQKNMRSPGTRTSAPKMGTLQFSAPHFFFMEF